LTGEGAGLIGFLVSDEAGARGALRAAEIEAKEVEVIRIALADYSDALAKATRKLATAGSTSSWPSRRGSPTGRVAWCWP